MPSSTKWRNNDAHENIKLRHLPNNYAIFTNRDIYQTILKVEVRTKPIEATPNQTQNKMTHNDAHANIQLRHSASFTKQLWHFTSRTKPIAATPIIPQTQWSYIQGDTETKAKRNYKINTNPRTKQNKSKTKIKYKIK